MKAFRCLSAVEQLASHLRDEILHGGLGDTMPGVNQLAASLGASPKTVLAALKQLEHEGILQGQGPRRRTRILPPKAGSGAPSLRVAILPCLPEDLRVDYIVDLQHLLNEQGHSAIFPSRSLSELGMDVKRVAKLVESTRADAWVVVAASKDVLQWFAANPVPSFAMFGRRRGLPIAGIGPDKETAFRSATRALLRLGHRRIALLVRPARRLPEPGVPERAFLAELESSGIQTGAFNLPAWEGNIESLHQRLDSMFRLTPSTALMIDEPPLFLSVQNHLARRGMLAPEHVSLVCTDGDPYFDALRPTVAHIRWDSRPWARRIVNWANGVACGKDDRRQSLTSAEFVDGGTIGPPPGWQST